LELSDPEDTVFKAAKVGLGALGIVSELTLKCIPQHRLLEHTYTTTPRQVRPQSINQINIHMDRNMDGWIDR
jgi:L-galactono-1,4-lactone dehydrogenase